MRRSSEQSELSGLRLSSARRGVVASHFERVFSWTCEMQRLEWKIMDDGSLVAHKPNWSMHIWWNTKWDRWELDATRLVNGSQTSYGACSQFLQDCIAIAEAWAAGAET